MSPPGPIATGRYAGLATPDRAAHGDPLARALGWASLALGIPQVLAPGRFAVAVGLDDVARHRSVVNLVGVRELVAGAVLLRWTKPLWLWARVAGDAEDLALLVNALKNRNGRGLRRTQRAFAVVLAITAIDLYAAITRSRREASVELTAATTIRKSPQDVYAYWRQLDNLPTFMTHLEEVRIIDDTRSHWRATAPFDKTVEWDAQITEEVPGERISWRSMESADVHNEGTVRFSPAPGGRGTEVSVMLSYGLPGGALGGVVARYFGEEPHQQLDDDLRRLKQVLETGEVVRSEAAPSGKRSRHEFPQHPARPLSSDEMAEIGQEVDAG